MIYDPEIDFGSTSIAIAGLGGTGAKVAARVAAILYTMQQHRMNTPRLVLIDPDVVEKHNIGRQVFLRGDIGENKAVAVMKYINAAFGLNVAAIPEPVSETNLWRMRLVLGCVDNPEARKVIHDQLSVDSYGHSVWIDAGNDRESGQVLLGDYRFRTTEKGRDKNSLKHIPIPSLILPDLIESQPAEAVPEPAASCAELVLRWQQDLLINDWMALVVAQYVKRLLLREPIHTFLTYVGSNALAVRSIPVDDLPAYLE